MSKKVLCKFFAHGACLKGDYCEFSHDWSDPPNNICTFYQKGSCSYGSRCRYDHVKASRPQNLVSSASNSSQMTYNLVSVWKENSGSVSAVSDGPPVFGRSVYPSDDLSDGPAWTRDYTDHYESQGSVEFSKNKSGIDPSTTKPANLPICSLAAAGNCPYGEKCLNMHGDLCPICGKHCLHPFRPDEREDHIALCQLNKKRLDALKNSQEIECSVCLDRVLSKPTPAERKFGILSECDHPFCISCIRNWRSNSPSSGMDVNSALRACPICRKLSYFVIPSVIWYFSKEEKLEIVDSYKAKLRSIDCRYFDFGNGTCPFGTSCFYKHAYRDGRLEEIVLRHLGAEDGNVVIARDIRLSDFITRLHL